MEINTCFVAMGYGIKRDPETNRFIDLDLTYNEIILPVMNELRIECIRNDEIPFPGSFEVDMYKHLRDDDLAIVDISTLNANAMYELGVRYALKPYSTIVISEAGTKSPANITQIRKFSYKHDGCRINEDSVSCLKKDLIKTIMFLRKSKPKIDSPIHRTFETQVSETSSERTLRDILIEADRHNNDGNFEQSEKLYRQILNEGYDIQVLKKLAVSIYKQGETNEKNLDRSLEEIAKYVDIEIETDPELLSTCGALYKKKWQITGNLGYLKKCKGYLERSFVANRSYYAGVNYAFSLICLASSLDSVIDKKANLSWGIEKYKEVKKICLERENEDDYWVCATIAECCLATGDKEGEIKYSEKAFGMIKDGWQKEITKKQMKELKGHIQELSGLMC